MNFISKTFLFFLKASLVGCLFVFTTQTHAQDVASFFQNKEQCKQDAEKMSKNEIEKFTQVDTLRICKLNIRDATNYKRGDRTKSLAGSKTKDGSCEATVKEIKKTMEELTSNVQSICEKIAAQLEGNECDSKNKNFKKCQENTNRLIGQGLTEKQTYVLKAKEKIKALQAANEKVLETHKKDFTCLDNLAKTKPDLLNSTSQCGIKAGELELIGLNGLISVGRPTTMGAYYKSLSGPDSLITEQKKVIELADEATKKLSSISESTNEQAAQVGKMIRQAKDESDKTGTMNNVIAAAGPASGIAQALAGNRSPSGAASLVAGIASASIGASQNTASTGSSSALDIKDLNKKANDFGKNDSEYIVSNGKDDSSSTPTAPMDNFGKNQFQSGDAAGISENAATALRAGGAPAGDLGAAGDSSNSKSNKASDAANKNSEILGATGGGAANEFVSTGSSGNKERESDSIEPDGDIASVLSKMKSMFEMDENPVLPEGMAQNPMNPHDQALDVFEAPESRAGGAGHSGNKQSGRSVASEKELAEISLFTRIRKVHRKSLQKGLIHFDSRIKI